MSLIDKIGLNTKSPYKVTSESIRILDDPVSDAPVDREQLLTWYRRTFKMDESILDEAKRIISGDRRKAYGDVHESFGNITVGWSAILKTKVTPEQVAQCMIWLKLCREANKHGRDNLVDIVGYTALLDQLYEPDDRLHTILKEAGE